MTTVITFTNQKGGVGKTTSSSAVISALANKGYKVLGIDLDPQGNLGFYFGIDIENSLTIYDAMKGNADFSEVIQSADKVDIVPSNILLSGAELEFNKSGREFMVKDLIARVKEDYDFIIIDTPPSLNVLTVNAYVCSDHLIIPMVPEILSLLGISQLKETIDAVTRFYNPSLRVLGVLLTKYNPRMILTREVEEMASQIAEQLDSRVFNSKVRAAVSAAESPAHGMSILEYAPDSTTARDYRQFILELIELLKEKPHV
ncbi:MAG: ParA family protein [Peptostreptococcaceae bacterium]|nr:ParA family protein [Peptostreptococcaceae bacterium]